ncbi:MAG: hypothetical protein KC777_17640 [Cyanobacteria bacterium HKST-UBA02]|nr:hypothetical protein [Cyanobacteria bacterium HKST-UBA02]
MSRERVLLLARDPGAANAIFPLVDPLLLKGYEVLLYGEGRALEKYRQFGLDGMDLASLVSECSFEGMKDLITQLAPDILITGTGSETNLEKYAWQAASSLDRVSMAIVDQWVNYGLRFSEYNLYQLDDYLKDPSHPFLPTLILAVDELARKGLIADSLPAERIVVTGQPYFEFIAKRARDFATMDTRSDRFRILFVSEPISKFSASSSAYPQGYSEITIFNEVRKALSSIYRDSGRRFELMVRLHPLEDPGNFPLGESHGVKVVIDQCDHPWTAILSCDLVCGMASTLLLEAHLMEKPVLSVQIGLTGEDLFILSRIGCLSTVTDGQQLKDAFSRAIVSGRMLSGRFDWIRDPIDRVIEQMENLLCKGLSSKP